MDSVPGQMEFRGSKLIVILYQSSLTLVVCIKWYQSRLPDSSFFSRQVVEIQFPKFYGEDVLGWIFKCDQFFLIDSTPEEEKVKIVSVHLFDKALFGSVYDDPIASLKNAKYDKSAKDYQDTYDNLLSKVEVSEEHAISLYLGGLPTELEMAVRMFKPKTLSDAYCLTTLQEATLEAVKKKSRFFGNQTIRRFGDTSGNGSSYKESLLLVPATNCNGQLYSLMLLPDPEEEEDEEFLDADETLGDSLNEEVQTHISLNALSGSTHNFLDIKMAKRIGCKISSTCPLTIFVPGGKQMVTMNECKDFQWQLYGHTFTADVMLLPLGGSDMVDQTNTNVDPKIQEVLDIYAEVCVVPNKLPLVRSHDHRIPLMPETQPVNIRPYRHPPVQKDAIKAMVKELLESGVIKHSQSSFASPVVMVKKKDNSWRMCVDYRKLNKHTIKDKFPIPVIEELIDELCAAEIFTKLC
ncbi:hypothetical protein Tco_0270726 [Tanacetum coccineum]